MGRQFMTPFDDTMESKKPEPRQVPREATGYVTFSSLKNYERFEFEGIKFTKINSYTVLADGYECSNGFNTEAIVLPIGT